MRIVRLAFFFVAVTIVNCQLQPYCKPTSPDTLGPFWVKDAPMKNHSVCDSDVGKKITVSGRVTDETCREGVQALIDVWQANEIGEYSDGKISFACRTRIVTDPQGYYKFSSIYPGRYLDDGGYRPAHIHYMVESLKPLGLEKIVTQLYFKYDKYLGKNDSCQVSCHSDDPTRQAVLKIGQYEQALETKFNVVLKKK